MRIKYKTQCQNFYVIILQAYHVLLHFVLLYLIDIAFSSTLSQDPLPIKRLQLTEGSDEFTE